MNVRKRVFRIYLKARPIVGELLKKSSETVQIFPSPCPRTCDKKVLRFEWMQEEVHWVRRIIKKIEWNVKIFPSPGPPVNILKVAFS